MRPLFAPAAAAEVKALSATAAQARSKAALELNPPSVRGRPYRTAWDIERAVRDGMKRITWVFRCIHVRASKSAGLPIVVRLDDPESGETVDDHPLLSLLNAYPAPLEDRQSAYAFRYRLSAIMDLNPQGAFVEVERSNFGDPIALRLLPPAYTAPIPGSDGKRFLDGFDLRVPGTPVRTLKPDDVIWCKHPHPTDPYDGLNPMQASGIAIDTEWLAKMYQRNFLKNDGRMGGLLLVAGEIDAEGLDELQASVDAASGPSSAGRVMVIEGTTKDAGTGEVTGEVGGVHFVDTSVSPREAAYIELAKATKEEIHGAWGVPTSIGAADSSNRTFENADADYYMFWSDTMVDHGRMLYRPFDLVDADPRTFCGLDFASVGVLRRDRIEREKYALEELKAGAIVADEYREVTDRDAFESGGDVVRAPLSMVPIATTSTDVTIEDLEPLPEPDATPAPAVLPEAAPPTPSGEALPEAAAAAPAALEGKDDGPAGVVRFGRYDVPEAALKARRRERARKLNAWERTAKRRLSSFFKRQERAVLEKLQGAKARQGTRHWVPDGNGSTVTATKVITADDIFDRKKWDTQLREEAEALVAGIVEDFGEDAYDSINDATKERDGAEEKAETPFDPGRLLPFIQARGNKIVGCNDTTYDALARELSKGEAAGETIAKLADRVEQVFDAAQGVRAETIARTEVISAANAGAIEGARQSDVVETKVWLAAQDERTRETHAEADGQSVPLEDPFEVGDSLLDAPGDPEGPPEETINCRCSITFETEGGSLI